MIKDKTYKSASKYEFYQMHSCYTCSATLILCFVLLKVSFMPEGLSGSVWQRQKETQDPSASFLILSIRAERTVSSYTVTRESCMPFL